MSNTAESLTNIVGSICREISSMLRRGYKAEYLGYYYELVKMTEVKGRLQLILSNKSGETIVYDSSRDGNDTKKIEVTFSKLEEQSSGWGIAPINETERELLGKEGK